ncbi:unnamed protein product, partial [Polarella glacialis]
AGASFTGQELVPRSAASSIGGRDPVDSAPSEVSTRRVRSAQALLLGVWLLMLLVNVTKGLAVPLCSGSWWLLSAAGTLGP